MSLVEQSIEIYKTTTESYIPKAAAIALLGVGVDFTGYSDSFIDKMTPTTVAYIGIQENLHRSSVVGNFIKEAYLHITTPRSEIEARMGRLRRIMSYLSTLDSDHRAYNEWYDNRAQEAFLAEVEATKAGHFVQPRQTHMPY